jgi:rod shape-determining protein MreC
MKISNGVRLSPRLKIIIAGVLIVLFFLALNLTPAKKETKNFFYLISSPIQKALWRIGDNISDFFEMVKEIKNLKKENQELKLKIQELIAENVALKELKRENEVLREALEAGLEKEFKLLLAEVIGKDISQDTLLIDLGSRDGISKDFPVINQQKALIGKIGEVYKNYSKVILISNKESTFDAKILEGEENKFSSSPFAVAREGEAYGVVKGKGNLKLFLDLIPREKEIKEGDLVVTAPLGGIFPKGLLIGEIVKVLKSDVMAWQQAEILPAFDINELETLFVITSY